MGPQKQRPVRVPVLIHREAIRPGGLSLSYHTEWQLEAGVLLTRGTRGAEVHHGKKVLHVCGCFSDTHHPPQTCCRPREPLQEVMLPHCWIVFQQDNRGVDLISMLGFLNFFNFKFFLFFTNRPHVDHLITNVF